jgi:hypothetical protein
VKLATTPATFVAQAREACDRATERLAPSVYDCQVAGTPVRLRFVGDTLRRALLPALSHLRVTALPPGPVLTIDFWDSATTGVSMPAPRWPVEAYAQRGEIRSIETEGVRAAFSVDGPMLDLWDPASGRAFFWAVDATRLPYYERGAPCRRIISWWLEHNGRQMIHAGAVGAGDRCVLLAGPGGSGKSNTALSCLSAGLTYLSDDYCALEPGDAPIAHSLFATGKVAGADLGRLPLLAPLVVNADRLESEKALFLLADSRADSLRTSASVQAVVVPVVRPDGPTALEPMSTADAARAIAISTIAQLPYAGAATFHRVAALVRQRPSYRLRLGPDAFDRAPNLLRRLAEGDDRDVSGG